ncbi:MAG: hypothetical protein ACP5UI_02325 [Thermoprotei archaeon]|nr:hypothetical protein [TACK group archaeon]
MENHGKLWRFPIYSKIEFKLRVGGHQKEELQGKRVMEYGDSVYRDGRLFLHMAVDVPEEDPFPSSDVIGDDLGMVNMADDPTGKIVPLKRPKRSKNL